VTQPLSAVEDGETVIVTRGKPVARITTRVTTEAGRARLATMHGRALRFLHAEARMRTSVAAIRLDMES